MIYAFFLKPMSPKIQEGGCREIQVYQSNSWRCSSFEWNSLPMAYWIKNHGSGAPCAGCCLYIEAIGNLRGQRSPKRRPQNVEEYTIADRARLQLFRKTLARRAYSNFNRKLMFLVFFQSKQQNHAATSGCSTPGCFTTGCCTHSRCSTSWCSKTGNGIGVKDRSNIYSYLQLQGVASLCFTCHTHKKQSLPFSLVGQRSRIYDIFA